jgi:hypothetical protein
MKTLYAVICLLCLTLVSVAWTAGTREKALLGRITVLAKENAGLEARVTRDALHAYCRVECGSCMPLSLVMESMTRSYTPRALEVLAMSDEEYNALLKGEM